MHVCVSLRACVCACVCRQVCMHRCAYVNVCRDKYVWCVCELALVEMCGVCGSEPAQLIASKCSRSASVTGGCIAFTECMEAVLQGAPS